MFGATMPERYILHVFSGGETTFNPTGSAVYHLNDLCVQECADCKTDCYNNELLKVDCHGTCELITLKSTVIAVDGEFFVAAASKGLVYENVTFTCYNENTIVCGFEEEFEDGVWRDGIAEAYGIEAYVQKKLYSPS